MNENKKEMQDIWTKEMVDALSKKYKCVLSKDILEKIDSTVVEELKKQEWEIMLKARNFKEKVKDFLKNNGFDLRYFRLTYYKSHQIVYLSLKSTPKPSLIRSTIHKWVIFKENRYFKIKTLSKELLEDIRKYYDLLTKAKEKND